ncbi:hypothetical protein GCM10020000_59440 [Streptomyces olivoverticillatus]
MPDPLVDHLLDGRYRVEARIAVGGMATVYRAMDTRLDRVLALKVMHPSLAADEAFVERFIREAKSAARLDHPNVVSVFDQGTDGHYVYLAMEYVAGCTLRDVLRERGALQPRAALDIAEPVLAALGAAHRAGLVHRDMKPENVLIGDDGRVKVADFGLVRAVDTKTTTSTGAVLGTVSYLAPPSSSRTARSTPGRTSTPAASCSTRCSPAASRTLARPPPRCSTSTSTRTCRRPPRRSRAWPPSWTQRSPRPPPATHSCAPPTRWPCWAGSARCAPP